MVQSEQRERPAGGDANQRTAISRAEAGQGAGFPLDAGHPPGLAADARAGGGEQCRLALDRLASISQLTQAVSEALDIGAIYEAVLDSLQQTLGADRASVLLLDDKGRMRFNAWRGLSEEYRQAVEGQCPWQASAEGPRPILVPDVEQEPALDGVLPTLRAEGIRALGMIPLLYQGRLLGQFVIYYDQPHPLTAEEIQWAQIIAGHIAFAVGRERAEEALRDGEERFRSLVETTSDWIWEVNVDDVYTYVSPKVKEILGYEPAEVLGKTPFDTMPPDEAERVRVAYHAVKARREPFAAVVNINRHRDGHPVVLETSGVPITDSQGRLRGYRGIDRDITARKRDEGALQFIADASAALSSSLDYRDTLNKLARLAVPILGDWTVLYTIDEEERFERAAVAAADPAHEELARRLSSFPPPLVARLRPQLEVLRTGKPQFFAEIPETLLEALATSPEHLQLIRELQATNSLTVPFQARGRLLGLAHFFFTTESGRRYERWHLTLAEEVARRAAVAVDNARLYRDAREAVATKDQFLAVLSHELRNPLAPILAGVTVLRRTMGEDERARRTVEIIDRNVKLQARLVNDLLDLSRIGRGKIQLQQAPVCLSTVAQSAVQTERPDAEDAGLTLSFEGPPGVWVRGDYDRLQQVVVNLLSNAIKFTPAPGQVHVKVEKKGDRGHLTVSDTGIGIPRELLPRLFGMFQQGEVAGRRKPGLGIGLALVKAITEMHGGRVWAESTGPGQGSRFHVELPLTAPPAPDTGRAERSDGELEVLLVEDNPDTRTVLADSLATMGFRVHPYATAQEGLEALSCLHPDVILSDIHLPGIDGYEFLRRARRLPGRADVPAFAITGFGQPDDVRHAGEAGYAGHFTKPVDVAILGERIRQWVHRK